MRRTARPAPFLPVAAAAALLVSCGVPADDAASTPSGGGAEHAATTEAGDHGGSGEHDWGYEGERAPEHWGDLPGAAACKDGKAQSPIDLTGAQAVSVPDPRPSYGPESLAAVDLGHTAQMLPGGTNTLTLDGTPYELAQIHQHTPSEHTIDGEHHPAELHLVHKDTQGRLAVLGVFVAEGAANPGIQRFLDAVPGTPDTTATATGAPVDLTTLLPADRRTYRYTGSLTTPPCTEGVAWTVFTTPITASAEQISALQDLSGENNRPTQPRHDRTLTRDTTEG